MLSGVCILSKTLLQPRDSWNVQDVLPSTRVLVVRKGRSQSLSLPPPQHGSLSVFMALLGMTGYVTYVFISISPLPANISPRKAETVGTF